MGNGGGGGEGGGDLDFGSGANPFDDYDGSVADADEYDARDRDR